MFQTIIVYIIIALAITYSVYAVVKNARKKEKSACDDCNGCDIKREITKNLAQKPTKDPAKCGHAPGR
ncbi:MAG: FeoB-associated Cys-rich membrane protein [Bacteroidota bacterium]|nr:FeoB-associated Cys-rich membrane protein [Bacteroidota bacterium]